MANSSVTLLKDLITVAVICLSPLVAWLTYISSFREKRRERFAALRRNLFEAKSEVDYIGNWARAEYPENSHSDNWNNPFWRVNDFPSKHIEDFNRQANPLEIGRSLSDAMIQLETSISRFRKLLAKHRQFVENGLETYAKLEGGETPSVRFRPPADWQLELYQLNKSIHTEGIGTESDPDGLHSTWARASAELEEALIELKQKVTPKLIYIGHFLAIVLGIVGIIFLIAFFFEAWWQFCN